MAMSEAPGRLIKPVGYIVTVLILGWAYTWFIFSKPDRMSLFPWIMLLPGVTALIMTLASERSWRSLIFPFIPNSSLKPFLFSVSYPLVFIGGCAFVTRVLGLASLNPAKVSTLVPQFSLPSELVAILLILGEEYGWRGYLLPELTRWKGPLFATVVVGLACALGHGPVLYGLASRLGTGNPAWICLIQMGTVLLFSFPFAYAYFQSESILPPMIFHSIWNTYNPIVLGNIYRNKPGLMEGNILLINGEGLVGVILGLFFMAWFARHLLSDSSRQMFLGAKMPKETMKGSIFTQQDFRKEFL